MSEPENELTQFGKNRRKFIVGSAALLGLAGLAFLEYKYNFPINFYDGKLRRQIDTYGDDGDRVAYAVNYLARLRGTSAVPADTVGRVMEFWKGLDSDTKNFVGGQIPTATATVLADEMLDSQTASYANQYPRLAFVHAHTNALFAAEPMKNIVDGDPRLIALANARYTQGTAGASLNYGGANVRGVTISKPDFVRSGFLYWAQNLGGKLNSLNPETLAATTNQTMAGDVVDQLGTIQYSRGGSKELLWFDAYQSVDFPPLYAYSKNDSTIVSGGTRSFGLDMMKSVFQKLPKSLKHNWENGQRTLQYFGDTGVASTLREWVKENYGDSQMPKGPEDDYTFYKKLYASQGMPAYIFEIITPNFQLGNQQYPLSSYFTVGVDETNTGISTSDSLIPSPSLPYFIDLNQSVENLKTNGWAGEVNYLGVYLPHQWHRGSLFKTLWTG